jgi:peroxiredoxin family protein
MTEQNEKSQDEKNRPLVIYAHSDGFDKLYQVASIALTAAVSSRPVAVVFFFWALKAVVDGKMDEFVFSAAAPEAAETARAKISTSNNPKPSEMLKMARESGRLKVFACSASMQYMGLELEEVKKVVDEVVGMSTILRLSSQACDTIYI